MLLKSFTFVALRPDFGSKISGTTFCSKIYAEILRILYYVKALPHFLPNSENRKPTILSKDAEGVPGSDWLCSPYQSNIPPI